MSNSMQNGAAVIATIAVALSAFGASSRRAPVVNGGSPSVSPDGKSIAFASDRSGHDLLYVISADGTGERPLTDDTFPKAPAVWSAQGARVVFSSQHSDSAQVLAVDLQSGRLQRLGAVMGRAAMLAPDGSRLVYSLGPWQRARLYVSRLDGTQAQPISDTISTAWLGVWSHDGKRIAYARRDSSRVLRIWIVNADGSGARQLTHQTRDEGQAEVPAWSPDDREIAMQVDRGDLHSGQIWIVNVATGTAKKLAPHDAEYLDETPSWFPDGKRIAFQSNRTGRMEIWVMNVDGSGAREVTR